MARPKKKLDDRRVIKRKYFSKKLNKWVEKEYIYDYRATNIKQTYTLRSGEKVTKIYNPAPKKEKKPKIKTKKVFKDSNLTNKTKLINKTGEVRMKQIEELSRMTGIEKMEIIQFVKSRFKEGNIQTAWTFKAFHSNNQVTNFLMNLGIDEDQLLTDINKKLIAEKRRTIDETWIHDVSNWSKVSAYKIDSPLLLPDGSWVDFEWDYELGSVYIINISASYTEDWT